MVDVTQLNDSELLELRTQLTKNIKAYENQQKVRKVNLNSAYGAMGSAYFRFYDTALAEAVTITGQMVIRWIANAVNDYLNKSFKTNRDYIIASDTDSVYINVDKVAEIIELTTTRKLNAPFPPETTVNMLDMFCKQKLQPLIDHAFEDIASYMNVALPCLSMVRDVIADNCIWTGKKHYAMHVYDSEGVRYEKPKLKVMGMEMVKSSTPEIVRKMLKDALTIIVERKPESAMWAHVKKCEAEFRKAGFEDVAKPIACNGLTKYEDGKGATIQVSAAQTYNKTLERFGIRDRYEPIRDGEKIKFAYLRPENPFRSHVIGATHGCPPEFEVEKWIDYGVQFEKMFLTPLNGVLKTIGWSATTEASVFD